jgi:hypothetical protein
MKAANAPMTTTASKAFMSLDPFFFFSVTLTNLAIFLFLAIIYDIHKW